VRWPMFVVHSRLHQINGVKIKRIKE